MKDAEDEEFERIERMQIKTQRVIPPEVTHMDRQCFERGCACIHYGVDDDIVSVVQRNDVLEEVAREFDKMKFGDTSHSFAIFVRNMKDKK